MAAGEIPIKTEIRGDLPLSFVSGVDKPLTP
jgi:hypothetical protein